MTTFLLRQRCQGNEFLHPTHPSIQHCSSIHVEIIDSDKSPSGVGRLAMLTLNPALANALYAATGKRLRALPLQHDLLMS